MTNATGIISRVNPAFERLTGYSSLEAVGRDFSLLTARGPHSEDYGRIWSRIFEHRPFIGRIELKNKSSHSFPVEITVTPVMDTRSQITSLVCTGVAITEEIANDPNLIRNEKDTDRIRDAGPALLNALMAITAQADLVSESLPPEHPLKPRLCAITTGCRSATAIVRSLMTGLTAGENDAEKTLAAAAAR